MQSLRAGHDSDRIASRYVHVPTAEVSDQRTVPEAGDTTSYPCPWCPSTATVSAPAPATAPQSASRLHSSEPSPASCASTVPRITRMTACPATAAVDGCPPTRFAHAGAGLLTETVFASQLSTLSRVPGSGFHPVMSEYVTASATIPTMPSAASNRPMALPLATRQG